MKDMIQKMTDLNNTQLNESVQECSMDEGPVGMPMAPEMDKGNPVSMNVSLNASGKEHVEDLINMMKNAGMSGAKEVEPQMMPMRMDMERLRDIVDEPEMEAEECPDCGESPCCCDEETDESYVNEPEEEYKDHEYMTKELSGGINREKKQFKASQPGDNAMAVENEIYNNLKAQYEELRNKD